MIKPGFSIIESLKHHALKISFVFTIFSFQFNAQPPQFKIYSYIDNYAEQAVQQMIEFKIPASVILAQAIYESRSGTSMLAKKSNNHFGIKCHVEWGGDTIIKHDDSLNECFRKYNRVEDSYTDHSLFLVSRARYTHLFKLGVADYKGWCTGLKNAGYATSPAYAEQLIKLIEETKLYELDGSENLKSGILFQNKPPEIKTSRYSSSNFALKDFSKGGLLWLDAGDVVIQSLNMIVDSPDDENAFVAGK